MTRDSAYRTWAEAAARPARASLLADSILFVAPWALLVSVIVLGARLEPRWSNGWERRPAFETTTITVLLWAAAALVWLALVLGIRRWKATGHASGHNRKWSSLVVLVVALFGLLSWWNWQHESTIRGTGNMWRVILFGRDDYSDQYPALMLLPIIAALLAGVAGLVVYLRTPPRPDVPDNPHRQT